MKLSPIPLIPLLMVCLGCLLGIGSVVVFNATEASKIIERSAPSTHQVHNQQPEIRYHDLNAARQSVVEIGRAALFQPDRIPKTTAEPVAVMNNQRAQRSTASNAMLIGIQRDGDQSRAIIIWRDGDEAESLGVGANSRLGTVALIRDSKVVFATHDGEEVQLNLFEE